MNKKANNIAFIYEGIKTEQDIFENINQVFFSSHTELTILNLPADGNIYMLWERLIEDEFETDVISILKEMNSLLKFQLADLKASDFSEIYLFFDFDIHNNNLKKNHLKNDVLGEMLNVFDNETEFGKLYISYPMVEAIKEISYDKREYEMLYIALDESRRYKKMVGGSCDFSTYKNITKEMWLAACDASRKRASIIVNYRSECNYQEFIQELCQKNIYVNQRKTYVIENSCIAILNSIPLFLLEYYQEDFWNEVIKDIND